VSFGCPAGSAGIDCAIGAGASISDYADAGLGTGAELGVGCTTPVPDGGLGHPCAFGGKNPSQAPFFMLQPIGRSVYNALQAKLVQNVNHPLPGLKAVNLQISYSLSRLNSTGGAPLSGLSADSDQDFILQTADNDKPGRYYGPSLLDRTHQLSFGGYVDAPGGFRIGLISHFYSPLSAPIAPSLPGDTGEIFRTDYTGDGTVGDPLPGTRLGEFDRGVNAKELSGLLANYNATVAGTATPAGQVLINNGLMTLTQLQDLGGVAPTVGSVVPGQVNFPWLKASDLKLAWRHTFKERFTIEPSVGFYNVFNFANFNLPPNTMNGLLDSGGAINTTDRATNEAFRVGNGTGVYALGAARQIEWGLRLSF